METRYKIDCAALVRHLALETFILQEAIANTHENGKEVIATKLGEACRQLYSAANDINPYERRTITDGDLPYDS